MNPVHGNFVINYYNRRAIKILTRRVERAEQHNSMWRATSTAAMEKVIIILTDNTITTTTTIIMFVVAACTVYLEF